MLTGLLVYGLRVFFRERLRGIPLPGPASAASPGSQAPYPWLCRMALRLSGLRVLLTGSYLPGPASAAPPGRTPQTPSPFLCRMALRLSGLRGPLTGSYLVGPVSAAPPGDDSGYGAVLCREAAGALPGLRSYDLSLIYSPLLLKLSVLTASKSLRRSRKAGAARMDAG